MKQRIILFNILAFWFRQKTKFDIWISNMAPTLSGQSFNIWWANETLKICNFDLKTPESCWNIRTSNVTKWSCKIVILEWNVLRRMDISSWIFIAVILIDFSLQYLLLPKFFSPPNSRVKFNQNPFRKSMVVRDGWQFWDERQTIQCQALRFSLNFINMRIKVLNNGSPKSNCLYTLQDIHLHWKPNIGDLV